MTELADLVPAASATAPTLVEGIQTSLRSAILKGSLPPGFRLREIPLAAHFGVSTTPIREAIRHLEHEGLVKIYPRRGAEVVAISSAEIDHLYEVRTVLECHAIRKAAESAPDEAALEPARKVVRAQERSSRQTRRRPALVDADFHREMMMLAGNPLIAELVERATRQIESVQARSDRAVVDGLAHAIEAHGAILAAVEQGDPDRAEDLMRKHLAWAQDAVLQSVRAVKDASSAE
ncbi:GntR family transcriptional regulator [Kribbella sp. NPDC050459]|uniref:GntR family transcriptional regulator n=1 Tax=Kribbella sp. NPDC050459 TaxID=3155785 RepID=UPI0033EB5A80